jgi:hypothetical protein
MSRTTIALIALTLALAIDGAAVIAPAQTTPPTETQRRECERNGGYWVTAAGYCKIGA